MRTLLSDLDVRRSGDQRAEVRFTDVVVGRPPDLAVEIRVAWSIASTTRRSPVTTIISTLR